MIDEHHILAIARISVVLGEDAQYRGTGFLVAPGRVLTALHVVADYKLSLLQKTPAFHPGEIWLTFGGYETEQERKVQAKYLAEGHDIRQDWVLLEFVDSEPWPKLPILPVGPLEATGEVLRWEAFGFPDPNPKNGLAVGGEVRSRAAVYMGHGGHLQLYCKEAADGHGASMSGLSGGPCIVDGVVVGMMRAALSEKQTDGVFRTVGGTLFALPLSIVHAQRPELLPKWPQPPQHLEPQVAMLLEQGGANWLKGMAAALASPGQVPEPASAIKVAAQLLRCDFDDVARLVGHIARRLSEQDATELLFLLSTGQLKEAAVASWRGELVRSRAKGLATAVAINADMHVTGQRYLFRACAGLSPLLFPQVRINWIELTYASEKQAKDYITEIFKVLQKQRRFASCATPDAMALEMRRLSPKHGPFVAIFHDPFPREEVLTPLQKQFSALHLCLLVGENFQDGTPLPLAQYLEPKLPPGRESEIQQSYVDACNLLHDITHGPQNP